ncbi:MAG: S46 family peptidase [Prevotella sp.]|nr:S46 family peptidase [Prevotellaceae bacterium]MDY3935662.1 S46 family peptidase [Prevotella sp.]
MKKSSLVLAGLLALSSAHADEGMWTLFNLPQPIYQQMANYGFQLPADQLYKGQNAISNYVVNFSGFCSGVVVSPDGLVFTNHHCGFGAINAHSTVEHDYMKDGFYAKSFSEELPNENMFVSFMRDQQDITPRVNALLKDKSRAAQEEALIALEEQLTDSIKKIDPTLHIEVKPFYEGNKYYATTYQEFRDVRLVFTVPKSMGKFGGDTDNWMWPRQTCDFSVFRIYADPKTNGPADYSKDNVPYRPKQWAPVTLDGYKEKDFAMTIGYPGTTNRYLSSYGIQQRRDIENTVRVQARDIKLALIKRYMDSDPAIRIQYEDAYASSANYWKNSMGMNKCIDSIGLIRQKAEYEAKIRTWLNQQTTKDPSVDVDFSKLAADYNAARPVVNALSYWQESFWRTTEFFARAMHLNRGMQLKGDAKKPKKQYCEFADNSNEWNYALDKELTAAMMKNYAEQVPAEYHPAFIKTVYQKFGGDFKKYTDYLYKTSKVLTKGAKFFPNDKKNFEKDPAVKIGSELLAIYAQLGMKAMPLMEEVENEEKKLCEAKLQMEMDMPHYSDANFTMRLSYGQVGGYMLGGINSGYYTTAESIVEKFKQSKTIPDYEAEPIMMDLLSAKDFGRYTDKDSKKMQLCFLTNNDITGGNSGSPIFDGKGRLIGLAFDGNWDSLSSDINFDRNLARCIGVDIRFVLYMMDKWGKAERLIKEINPQ